MTSQVNIPFSYTHSLRGQVWHRFAFMAAYEPIYICLSWSMTDSVTLMTLWQFQSLLLYIYMSRLVWILINSLHSRFCDLWPGYIWPWKWSILLFITWNSERETDWPLWLPVSWCIAHHHHHHHLTGFCPKSSVLSTLAPRLIRVSQAACIPAIAARWRGVCFFWKSYLSLRKIFVSENSEYFVKY